MWQDGKSRKLGVSVSTIAYDFNLHPALFGRVCYVICVRNAVVSSLRNMLDLTDAPAI